MDLGRRADSVKQKLNEDTHICFFIVFSIPCRSDFWRNIGGGAYVLCKAPKNFPSCCTRVVDKGPIVTRSCQTEVTNTYVTVTCTTNERLLRHPITLYNEKSEGMATIA